MTEQWVDVASAAAYWQLSRARIYQMIARRAVQFQGPRGAYRINVQAGYGWGYTHRKEPAVSRTRTIARTIEMETLICCVCSVPFALDAQWLRVLKSGEGAFYCPNGHYLSYKKHATRLQDQVDQLKQELAQRIAAQDQAEAGAMEARRQLAAERREAQRVQRRIANGVCPCCNRHFVNVARHMKGQHPDYVGE